MVRSVLTAAASFADFTAAFQPVTPTAMRMPMIAITIINSISENPRSFLGSLRWGFIHSPYAGITRSKSLAVPGLQPWIWAVQSNLVSLLRTEQRAVATALWGAVS